MLAVLSRICLFIALPDTPSQLAPDEGTYARLASWVGSGKNVMNFPEYGGTLYFISRSLILPAALMVKLGISPLNAVRLVSLLFGFLSILVFTALISKLYFQASIRTSKNINFVIVFIYIIYLFLPSHLVWSVLGLRESVSEFWILISFLFLNNLTESVLLNKRALSVLFAAISLMFSYGARPQTATVFLFSTGLTLLMASHGRLRITIGAALTSGLICGVLFTNSPQNTIFSPPQFDSSSPSVSESPANPFAVNPTSKSGNSASQSPSPKKSVTTKTMNTEADSIEADGSLASALGRFFSATRSTLIGKGVNIEQVSNLNREGALSKLPKNICSDFKSNVLDRIICNSRELPYRMLSNLFRPLFPLDRGSLLSNIASLENLMWIVLCALSILGFAILIRNRRLSIAELQIFNFAFLFICGSALYEGNLGTAFRHKSSILWCLLFLILAGFTRIKKTNNIIQE